MDIQPFLKPAGHRDHLECFTALGGERVLRLRRPRPVLPGWGMRPLSMADLRFLHRINHYVAAAMQKLVGGVSAPAAEGVKVTDETAALIFLLTRPLEISELLMGQGAEKFREHCVWELGHHRAALAALRIAADREVEALQWVMMVRYRRLRAWSEARGLKRVLLRLRGGFQ
jgi:hypothetical protein